MTFENPAAFYWLALLPFLVLVRLFRRPPRALVVPSLALWLDVLAIRSRRRWREILSAAIALFLQCLLVGSLVLAHSRPHYGRAIPHRPERGDLAILVDASASMSAVEADGETRLEKARSSISRLARLALPAERVTVVACGDAPVVLARQAESAAEVDAALQELDILPGTADLARSLAIVRALYRDRTLRVVVLTDAAGETGESLARALAAEPADVQVRTIGTALPNSGLAGVRAERRWGENDLHLFLEVSSSEAAGVLPVHVRYDGKDELLAAHPGERVHVVLDPGDATSLEVRLANGDALAADDSARLAIPPPRRVRVWLVSPGGRPDPFLVDALGVQADRIDGEGSRRLALADWSNDLLQPGDLAIFDRCHPPAPPERGASIFLDPAALETFFAIGPGPAAEGRVELIGRHPLLASLALESLHVAALRSFDAPPELAPIARAGTVPLLLVRETPLARSAYLSFALADSNLPALADFPLLVRNLLVWADALRPAPAAEGALVGSPESDLAPRPLPAGMSRFAPLYREEDEPYLPLWPPFLAAGIAFAVVELAYHLAREARR
ncbi:MAG: VWA domain-containing protein [Planctomycetes bacterium]|nr:VWA domain-containing protein [Planctomycetota bacterium]